MRGGSSWRINIEIELLWIAMATSLLGRERNVHILPCSWGVECVVYSREPS